MLGLLWLGVTWKSSCRCLMMEGLEPVLLSLTTVQNWVLSCRNIKVNYMTLCDKLFILVSPLENPSSGTRISRASTRIPRTSNLILTCSFLKSDSWISSSVPCCCPSSLLSVAVVVWVGTTVEYPVSHAQFPDVHPALDACLLQGSLHGALDGPA